MLENIIVCTHAELRRRPRRPSRDRQDRVSEGPCQGTGNPMCCDELLQFNRPYCHVQILQGALWHRCLVHFRWVQPYLSGGTLGDCNANQWNYGCSQNQEDILRLLRLPRHQNHHHLFHCHHNEPRVGWSCGTAWQPEGFVQTSSNDGAGLSTYKWNQTLLLRLRCIQKTGS